ncbi:unnamed protein product [Sphenostylis stenocarpa]|uniref:Uncharacterized protein n=1 Tax=Sphenostylis stenocarpa TaxID=92480 RepID=A0AA86VEU4_9FABA|nr:unnamed protein product [Sphenostylis stenocarpa]
MWVFYMISLPLTVGMVLFTLRYYAAPRVPRYVLFTVGYTWLSSLSIIVLVPADIWTKPNAPQNTKSQFLMRKEVSEPVGLRTPETHNLSSGNLVMHSHIK